MVDWESSGFGLYPFLEPKRLQIQLIDEYVDNEQGILPR